MLSLSYRYLSDVKNEYQMKYQTFTCPVFSEIVNQILYQKNRTIRSNSGLPGNPIWCVIIVYIASELIQLIILSGVDIGEWVLSISWGTFIATGMPVL